MSMNIVSHIDSWRALGSSRTGLIRAMIDRASQLPSHAENLVPPVIQVGRRDVFDRTLLTEWFP